MNIQKNGIPIYGQLKDSDYIEMGFKSGLEIHQQLLTERKLFCRCPAGRYSNDYDAAILRHMRPTMSEMGTYDGTALMEFKKKKEVLYLLNHQTTCTYEMDDTPPFMINQNALDIAIEIALLLNCNMVGELHIMRKQYLDGSIPTGFQRTALVGVNGWIPYKDGRKIGIRQLAIEEDSCREVSDEGHRITFITDRLSMPLIEIVTEPEMRTPEEVAEVCRLLWMLTHSTGKVRQGLGAVREDVNVSVTGGTRIEIKGVPRIPLIPKLTHYEAFRQAIFVDMANELKEMDFKAEKSDFSTYDITEIAGKMDSEVLKNAICRGKKVSAIKVDRFNKFFHREIQPDWYLADELSERVRVVACQDQPPHLMWKANQPGGLSDDDYRNLREHVKANYEDAVAVVWGNENEIQTALGEIKIRVNDALIGVPDETRQAHVSGLTGFERVLPGPDRMYPDTDLPPLPITQDRIDSIDRQAPPRPWDRRKRYQEMGLSENLIDELLIWNRANIFDSIIHETDVKATVVANAIAEIYRALLREGHKLENMSHELWASVFAGIDDGLYSKEAIPYVLIKMSEALVKADKAAHDLGLKMASDDEVNEHIDRAIAQLNKLNKSEAKERWLMGLLMQDLRGCIDGEDLEKRLIEKL